MGESNIDQLWGLNLQHEVCALTPDWTLSLLVYRTTLQPNEQPGQGKSSPLTSHPLSPTPLTRSVWVSKNYLGTYYVLGYIVNAGGYRNQ